MMAMQTCIPQLMTRREGYRTLTNRAYVGIIRNQLHPTMLCLGSVPNTCPVGNHLQVPPQ